MKNPQRKLIDLPRDWDSHWKGMPEFHQEDLRPWQSIIVHFADLEDRRQFAELIKQRITNKTKFIWYPQENRDVTPKVYITRERFIPRYPVYIASKGRADSRITSRYLDELGIPYFIIVEEQEFDQYVSVIDESKILVLPRKYLDEYDTCDDLGATKSKGPGAARNFAWDHSLFTGAARHWILDDNISGFIRVHQNRRIPFKSGAFFRIMEDFVDRFENIALAGPNYRFFGLGTRTDTANPFQTNTRIYSFILIKNDIKYRWRGRYNEDTDLSLRVLKDGLCTVLFNALKCNKRWTQTTKGGNTKEFYQQEGTLLKSEMLERLHPDVARITRRYNRDHHYVDYSSFSNNELIYKSGISIPEECPYKIELINRSEFQSQSQSEMFSLVESSIEEEEEIMREIIEDEMQRDFDSTHEEDELLQEIINKTMLQEEEESEWTKHQERINSTKQGKLF